MIRNLFNIFGFCLILLSANTAMAETSFDASAGGSIIPGYDSTACTSAIAGAIRYNSSSITAGPTDYTNYWTMDDTSGTTVTDSGGSSNGTWQGSAAVSSVSGMVGTALYFSGSTYVTFADAASLEAQNNMTISMWIKPDAAGIGTSQILLYKTHSASPWYSWIVGTTASAFPYSGFVDNVPNYPTIGGARFYADQWYHFVGTLSGGKDMLLYLNGVRSESWYDGAIPGTLVTTTDGQLGLAATPSGSSAFTGTIDDVRIYNRTLSASEIYQLYQEGLNGGVGTGTGCIEYCNGTAWICTNTAFDNNSNSSVGGISPAPYYDFEGGAVSSDFILAGDANWTVQTTNVQEGTYAAVSGSITDNQSSSMTLHVNLTSPKTVSFWMYASTEGGWDPGMFMIDDVPYVLVSDTTGSYTQYSFTVPAGEHYLTWTYVKDNGFASGNDAVYVDYITFQ